MEGYASEELGARVKQDIDLKVRLAKREKHNKELNLPRQFTPSILGPTHLWKVCYTQSEAFQLSRSFKKDLHVFSFESESFQDEHGKRMFLVTSYEEFWHYYSQLKPEQRHHYEIIPEGSVCHLYFDLEFMMAANPGANGTLMTSVLMKYVFVLLWKEWGIKCDESNVLQLDASTDLKFSMHLIFHLKGAAFKDNIQMGYFITHIFALLKAYVDRSDDDIQERKGVSEEVDSSDRLTDEILQQNDLTLADLKSLIVKNTNGKDILFCDTGVYTKNRNFRLYLSSKLRKNNPLNLAAANQYIPKPIETPGRKPSSQEQMIFMDSLIVNVEYSEDMKILAYTNKGKAPSSNDSVRETNSPFQGENVVDGCNQDSPYPEIDRFVESIIDKGGVQGKIRRWLYFAQAHTLLYDISRNRWCENIGRAHRSNNVMIVVDLVKCVYYQKCHDPECRQSNYRSNDYPLPQEVTDLYSLPTEDEWPESDEDLSDDLLMSLVTDTKDLTEDKGTDTSLSAVVPPGLAGCDKIVDRSADEAVLKESDNLNVNNASPCKKLKLSDKFMGSEIKDTSRFDEGFSENLSDDCLVRIVEDTEHSFSKV